MDASRERAKTVSMRRGRATLLLWGVVAALAPLSVAATPHFHEAEGCGDTCVQGAPLIASIVHEPPDPAGDGAVRAPAPRRACAAEIEDHGSRAPPA